MSLYYSVRERQREAILKFKFRAKGIINVVFFMLMSYIFYVSVTLFISNLLVFVFYIAKEFHRLKLSLIDCHLVFINLFSMLHLLMY